MVSGIAQLNKEYFANTKVELDYKSVEDGWNYGVKAELALPSSTYTVNTGIRSEANGTHLRVSAATPTDGRSSVTPTRIGRCRCERLHKNVMIHKIIRACTVRYC